MSVHISNLHHECGCWEIKELGMSFLCSTHSSLTTTYDQSLGRKGKAERQVSPEKPSLNKDKDGDI